MSLNTVTLTFSEQDAGAGATAGAVTIAPTSVVTAAGVTVVSQQPVVRQMTGGSASVSLVACDNAGTSPASGFWAYSILLPGATQPGLYLVNFANGATQRFDSLSPAVASTTYGPAATGGVTSFNTRTGAVTPQSGDYTAAQVGAVPVAGGTMTGALAPAVVALAFGASIALNAALGNVFAVTLTASTGTLASPTSPVDGQVIRVRVIQGAGGSFTLAYGAAWDFGAAGSPTLSTAAGKVDLLGFEYVASLSKWVYLGSALGN